MDVIGRGDHHSVDALLLFEHEPKVAVFGGFRKALEGFCRPVPIHVAKRDDILALEFLEISGPAPACANNRDVQPAVSARFAARAQHVPRQNRHCCRHRAGLGQKSAPGKPRVRGPSRLATILRSGPVRCFKAVQDFDKAISQYKQVLRLKPDWSDTYFNLAILHLDSEI